MLQPSHGGVQVDIGPVAGSIAAKVTGDGVVRVRAGIPGREGVVEAGSLNYDLLVVGSLVVRNAEETCRKVDAITSFSDSMDLIATALTRSRPSDLQSKCRSINKTILHDT